MCARKGDSMRKGTLCVSVDKKQKSEKTNERAGKVIDALVYKRAERIMSAFMGVLRI